MLLEFVNVMVSVASWMRLWSVALFVALVTADVSVIVRCGVPKYAHSILVEFKFIIIKFHDCFVHSGHNIIVSASCCVSRYITSARVISLVPVASVWDILVKTCKRFCTMYLPGIYVRCLCHSDMLQLWLEAQERNEGSHLLLFRGDMSASEAHWKSYHLCQDGQYR